MSLWEITSANAIPNGDLMNQYRPWCVFIVTYFMEFPPSRLVKNLKYFPFSNVANKSSDLWTEYWSTVRSTDLKLTIHFGNRDNRSSPITAIHLFKIPCSSNLSNSFPVASLIAKGTGLVLKNHGVALGFTFSTAFFGCTVPSSSLNNAFCLSSKSFRPIGLLWIVAIRCQSRQICFSQFFSH